MADDSVDQLLAWAASGASVDDHLADQLLPFLALASGRSVLSCPTISLHLRTMAWVIERFLPVRIALCAGRPSHVEIAV